MEKILSRGSKSDAYTERGTSVQVQYAIVELDSLIASHTIDLKKNSRFPTKLQPRDRSRIASETQVSQIAKDLKPPLLGAYSSASNGAPIVGPDLVVESGTARVVGLMRYYRREGPANAYREYLVAEAKALKLAKTPIAQAQKPVLVRLRLTRVNRETFVRECNEPTVATLSAAEQAAIDAESLTADLLSLFASDEGDNIASVSNREFVRGFMAQVVAPAERGRYVDGKGVLSQDGVRRIQYALCSKAYGEPALLERLSESVDDKIKKISAALINKAAKFATLKVFISKKKRHPLDITPHLTAAVRRLSALRDTNQSVKAFLSQAQLVEKDEMSPLARDLLVEFDRRKGRGLENILERMIQEVNSLGHPGQGQLGDRQLPSLEELLKDALKHRNQGKEPKGEGKTRQPSGGSPSLIEVRALMDDAKKKEESGDKSGAIKIYQMIAGRKSEHPRKAWRARQALERLGITI